jgi:hypothetical protein
MRTLHTRIRTLPTQTRTLHTDPFDETPGPLGRNGCFADLKLLKLLKLIKTGFGGELEDCGKPVSLGVDTVDNVKVVVPTAAPRK